MHSFHPYVQRRRKRRRIGGRVVERRTVSQGRNVLFTTQVRRGVLRLFGTSSAVFPSPPGSSSPPAVPAAYPEIPLRRQAERAGSPGAAPQLGRRGTPGRFGRLGICSGISWSRSKPSSESPAADSLALAGFALPE